MSSLLTGAVRRLKSDPARLPKGISPASAARALKAYYADILAEDLAARTPDDLVDVVVEHFQTGQRRKAGEVALTVRSTSPSRAVVDIVVDDMPFLVDSVTGEVLRHDYSVRFLVHPILRVERNRNGTLQEINGRDGINESWMHFEVVGLRSPEDVEELTKDLHRVLDNVSAAVEDWAKMRLQAVQIAAELRTTPPNGVDVAQLDETVEFLDWLADNHFTFLGYREYDLVRSRGSDRLRPVDGTGLGISRDRDDNTKARALPPASARKAREKRLLILTKASSRATVHRTAYLDYVGVKTFNAKGDVVGERRFLGLLTSTAYRERVENIPVIGNKIREMIRRAGYEPGSHSAKDLRDVIESFPRDELLQASVDQILPVALAVVRLPQRRQTRLFVRRDDYGRFYTALVFLPRDRYSTPVRLKMVDILTQELGGTSVEYSTQSSASPLARLEFVIRVPEGSADSELSPKKLAALQRKIVDASRSWDDDLADELRSQSPEDSAEIERIADAMSAGYRANFGAKTALQDIVHLRRLERLDTERISPVDNPAGAAGLSMQLFFPGEDAGHIVDSSEDLKRGETIRLKIYSIGRPMSLSSVLPIIQDLGVRVSEENTFEFDIRTGEKFQTAWIYDFTMSPSVPVAKDRSGLQERFIEALAAAWSGVCESDSLASLTISSGFTWRETALLRAYMRYLQMGGMTYSKEYVEQTLTANAPVVSDILELFTTLLNPARTGSAQNRESRAEKIIDRIREALVDVALDEDRILTALTSVIGATLRTNFFQLDDDGHAREVISFKIDPHQVPDLPAPRPYREMWVYSPRFEGTHLRFGPIARGGLRWSDRREDMRTEILGLVKAQLVKNTVIVPTGAKGGFVPKNLPDPSVDREAWLAEGIACYRGFIRSLLQLTDNRVGNKIVPPDGVVRRDGDDPYLVVAADKGTATFSDFANEESINAGFWLGDAFASGGSVGYDHKDMGITARGAWESVKRHFRELGVDTQTEDFTVIGIGDMSGDVFGNGVLLSEHIRLVAAFDHRHIFIDPAPNAATSYAERRRVFELPRSSWEDYDRALISDGGGIWPRTAKSIALNAAIRDALGIDAQVTSVTPAELMKAILLAPVDLFWNGGIGTYVKSSTESNAQVGDRANDAVRVDGQQLRVRVVGEGGNLGLTQRGRIEYALVGGPGASDDDTGDGGRLNTDAIDNSAGVDTSDHEVNIKILLEKAIDNGDLNPAARNRLLARMADNVGELVLQDNYNQNVALQMEERNNLSLNDAHRRLMILLEREGLLDRAVEFLPTDDQMRERAKAGRGLTSPELSVLLAYSKLLLEKWILATDLPDDPAYAHLLTTYFPTALQGKYAEAMTEHPLHREIVATSITNRFINNAGTTGPMRMMEETGASADAVLRAQSTANRIFELPQIYETIATLDSIVPADVQTTMRIEQQRLVERGTRWMLRNCPQPLDIVSAVERYHDGVLDVIAALPEAIRGLDLDTFTGRLNDLEFAGVPRDLAVRVAVMPKTIAALDIVDLVDATKADTRDVATAYFAIADKLQLSSLLERIIAVPRDGRWRSMARGTLRDDLNAAHAALTGAVVAAKGSSMEDKIEAWYAALPETSVQALDMLAEIMESSSIDLASIVVAVQLTRDVVGGTTTTH